MTSFDVIRAIRRNFSGVKIGHAGTLDPDASGLLILAIGNATRFLAHLDTEPKVYRFTLDFGCETDTLDATGVIVHDGGTYPSREALEEVLVRFTGTIEQIPPAYSAVKTNGRRAYKIARQGGDPELKPRQISVFHLQLLSYDTTEGNALLEVSCSGGTYVRSLARDIARTLGTYGHTSGIRRLTCGTFTENEAVAQDAVNGKTPLIPIQTALRQFPVWEADDVLLADIYFGRDVQLPTFKEDSILITEKNNHVVALVSRTAENSFHPSIVCLHSDTDRNS